MIGITTGLMLMVASTGASARTTPVMIVAQVEEAKQETTQNFTVEDVVRDYFKDTPILAEVARCESQFRQYGTDGNPLKGTVDPRDVGVMQINRYYHGDTAKKLGFDLTTIEGNMAYAKNLYDRQGVAPWSASAPCWSKTAVGKEFARK